MMGHVFIPRVGGDRAAALAAFLAAYDAAVADARRALITSLLVNHQDDLGDVEDAIEGTDEIMAEWRAAAVAEFLALFDAFAMDPARQVN